MPKGRVPLIRSQPQQAAVSLTLRFVCQGFDVQLSLIHVPRHTKEVDAWYQKSLLSISTVQQKFNPMHGIENLNGTACCMARQLSDLCAVLGDSDMGGSVLANYARGVRGQLLHGWVSCMFRPGLGLLQLCVGPAFEDPQSLLSPTPAACSSNAHMLEPPEQLQ